MSRETIEWLNSNVLVGFTDKRGHAWHYRQGSDNHYPGAIPVGDVESRLFMWEPVSSFVPCACGCGDRIQYVSRSDNRHRMGVFTDGYEPHSYRKWLLNQVSSILGDTLQIGSAGLLKRGAVAWVSVEVPESITTPEGVEFRPHLLATTSFDGSVATTYKRVVTVVVCDNTRDLALGEKGQQFKVKHTRNSQLRITDARQALQMVHSTADDFQAEVRRLIETEVTVRQWSQFLDTYVPMPGDKGRARTMAENKREALHKMYRYDKRCADWTGTAFGVLQTVNTFNLHESIVRNVSRPERNMLSLISGREGSDDREALDVLRRVLAG